MAGDRLELLERGLGRLLGEHARLVRRRRVADRHPHREAVSDLIQLHLF
jgi:hypothetical protein